MSNESHTPDQDTPEAHEQFQHTYTSSSPDIVLHDLVAWANAGVTQDVTISVKGTLFTGQLIGGAGWCDLQIDGVNNAGGSASSEILENIKNYYLDVKENRYSPSAIEANSHTPIHYLHMKDVKVWDGQKLSGAHLSWRFKLGEIDGFSIGSLS